MIKIYVNGKPLELATGSTLIDATAALGMEKANIVAELNGNIIKKEDFSITKLVDGARLELVRFVGGG